MVRTMSHFHIIVNFGEGIPVDEQGPVMLAMEKALRERGIPAEVFKERVEDDSKLRNLMTLEMRDKL